MVGLEPRRGRQPVPVVTRPSRRCQTPVRWGFVGEGERGQVEACLPDDVGGQAAKAGLERGPGRRCSGGRTQVQVDGLEAEEVAFDVGCTMGAGPPNETKRGRT